VFPKRHEVICYFVSSALYSKKRAYSFSEEFMAIPAENSLRKKGPPSYRVAQAPLGRHAVLLLQLASPGDTGIE
jgi:hypothetical protein